MQKEDGAMIGTAAYSVSSMRMAGAAGYGLAARSSADNSASPVKAGKGVASCFNAADSYKPGSAADIKASAMSWFDSFTKAGCNGKSVSQPMPSEPAASAANVTVGGASKALFAGAASRLDGDYPARQSAIAPDGSFFTCHDKTLSCYDSGKNLLWEQESPGYWVGVPSFTREGKVMLPTRDGCYVYDRDGKTSFSHHDSRSSFIAALEGDDGTYYFMTEGHSLLAFDPKSGDMKWEASCRLPSDCATGSDIYTELRQGPDGTVYLGSHDNHFYAISRNGEQKWSFSTGWWISSGAAFGKDGTIYTGSDDGNVYALTQDGEQRWRFRTGKTVASPPSVSEDGTIYAGSADGNVYALNTDGSLRWKFETKGPVFGTPLPAGDGNIYLGSGDGNVYCLGADGSLRWKYDTGAPVRRNIYEGPNNELFVQGRDDRLRVIDVRQNYLEERMKEESEKEESKPGLTMEDGWIVIDDVHLPVKR